ncbi:MAG: helix-turn-helix transcriptional regulator [Methylococcaceae bacterium]
MSVNEKIKQIRQAKDLTQEEVAAKLQMSNNGYGDIERGATDIKLSRLHQLAELFEITLADIIGLSNGSVVNLACENNKCNQTANSSLSEINTIKAELEKQLLINQHQCKEIELLTQKINDLNKIIELLENKIVA